MGREHIPAVRGDWSLLGTREDGSGAGGGHPVCPNCPGHSGKSHRPLFPRAHRGLPASHSPGAQATLRGAIREQSSWLGCELVPVPGASPGRVEDKFPQILLQAPFPRLSRGWGAVASQLEDEQAQTPSHFPGAHSHPVLPPSLGGRGPGTGDSRRPAELGGTVPRAWIAC